MSEKNIIDHKSLFDQMPVKRYLVERVDDEFVIATVNKLASKFFNKSAEDLVGKTLREVLSNINYTHMHESLDVSYTKNVPVTLPALPELLNEMQSSGYWISPVCDDDNNVIFLDIISQPSTTDISIIERERDDALSLLTSIFDASEVGILVFDRNRRIIKINDSFERIYGWPHEETIGVDFLEFVTDDEVAPAKLMFNNFIKTEERESGEVKIFCKDGTIANTAFTTATLKLSHGRKFQVTTIVDITKWKQINMSLKLAKEGADAANNAKSSFLANMSHELRTPLNAIIGFSEMMMNESFGPLGNPKYNEYLGDVFMSAKHLLEIINEVLDMSKIEAGKIELDEQEIDLNGLIEILMRIMKSRSANSGIQIKEAYQDDIPKLYADPRLIRQILINLVTNSIKYSLNGGTITVSTSLNAKNEIEVDVADQGVGIPEDRIKDAMEPFGQIHDPSTHSEIYQGTGLGLPLAKAMVELHGGVFSLKSKEGVGTTVKMSFSSSRTVKNN